MFLRLIILFLIIQVSLACDISVKRKSKDNSNPQTDGTPTNPQSENNKGPTETPTNKNIETPLPIPSPTPSMGVENIKQQIFPQIQAESLPNKYMLSFRNYRNFSEDIPCVVELSETKTNKILTMIDPSIQTSIPINGGSKFHFKMRSLDYKIIFLETNIEIPFDLELNQTYDFRAYNESHSKTAETSQKHIQIQNPLIENNNIFYRTTGRIFLTAQTHLILGQRNFSLIAKEFIFEPGSQIVQFPDPQLAPNGTNGKSGGFINLEADLATGVVAIVLSGEDGGNGDTPADLIYNKGRKANGQSAKVQINEANFFDCLQPATSGENGLVVGDPGPNGGAAGNGGNTGHLTKKIANGSKLQIQVTYKPGKAGIPGQGGLGSFGELGGFAGTWEDPINANRLSTWDRFMIPLYPFAGEQDRAQDVEWKANIARAQLLQNCKINEVKNGNDADRGTRGQSGNIGKDGIISEVY